MMQNATQIASELLRGKGMVVVWTGSPDQILPPSVQGGKPRAKGK